MNMYGMSVINREVRTIMSDTFIGVGKVKHSTSNFEEAVEKFIETLDMDLLWDCNNRNANTMTENQRILLSCISDVYVSVETLKYMNKRIGLKGFDK